MAMLITRRDNLIGAVKVLALGAAGLSAPGSARADGRRPRTPAMDLGPFYPVQRPLEEDADLTRLKGHKARAKGEVIEISGRVLTASGGPQPGAVLEVWQANFAGRYNHPNDLSDPPLDPDFQGYARVVADDRGAFRFLTVKPAFYKAGDFLRAAHIHLDVRGLRHRLITQLYFPADIAFLRQDKVLMHDMGVSGRDAFPAYIFPTPVAAGSQLQPGAAHWRFDVVLMG